MVAVLAAATPEVVVAAHIGRFRVAAVAAVAVSAAAAGGGGDAAADGVAAQDLCRRRNWIRACECCVCRRLAPSHCFHIALVHSFAFFEYFLF